MKRGFTLIELLIVVAIIAIATAVGFPAIMGKPSGNSNVSFGTNGMIEERCIGGYKFVVGGRGQPSQILNEFGKGVPCDSSGQSSPPTMK